MRRPTISNPAARAFLAAVLLLLLPGPSGAFEPLTRPRPDRSWAPARQTAAGDGEGGLSPAPTARPALGEMELLRRYDMGTDTCGFASGYKCKTFCRRLFFARDALIGGVH
jgi:hypothetical protein